MFFLLLASDDKKATQLCPCGYLGDPERPCRCTPEQIQRYRARISGPLLDRIDLHVQVGRVPAACLLTDAPAGEPSRDVRERVCRARARQLARQGCPNSQLPVSVLASTCLPGEAERKAVEQAANQLQLSARGVHRLLRVALTISDLAGQSGVQAEHIGEALGYRGTT